MKKPGKIAKSLLALTALSSTGADFLTPDRVSLEAAWQFPRLSQESKVIGMLENVTGHINTFKESSQEGGLIMPVVALEYNATRFIPSPVLEKTFFYGAFSYNEGKIPTSLPMHSHFELSRTCLMAGVGVKTYLFREDENKPLNPGLEVQVDYHYGKWGGNFNSPLLGIKLSGKEQGLGVYVGGTIEWKIPKPFDQFLPDDTKGYLFCGYNFTNFGSFSDFRGPIAGVGITINLTEHSYRKKY